MVYGVYKHVSIHVYANDSLKVRCKRVKLPGKSCPGVMPWNEMEGFIHSWYTDVFIYA